MNKFETNFDENIILSVINRVRNESGAKYLYENYQDFIEDRGGDVSNREKRELMKLYNMWESQE